MQLILYLLQKYKNTLLFLFFQLIAFILTVQLHSYQRSKFINSANIVTGGVYENFLSIQSYLHLKEENESLSIENSKLKQQLALLNKIDSSYTDTVTTFHQKFSYTPAKVINNNFKKRNNFLTLNKGITEGVTQDLAVVNAKGIVGIVNNSSSYYATVISVLNTKFLTNARFKKNDFFGTLTWDGEEINKVQLNDIPREAEVKLGDTIITGGKSAIFPEGILIGTIENVEFHNNNYSKIDVRLFNNMKSIQEVHIIKNLDKIEIEQLEAVADE